MKHITADIVLKSGTIFNGVDEKPFKGSIAVVGKKIVAVGGENEVEAFIGEGTKVFDCKGKLVSPGFVDSHTHIAYGSFLIDHDFAVDISDSKAMPDYLAKVKRFGEEHPDNEWVFGHHAAWAADDIPGREDIDAVISDRPVVLQHMDFHSLVANSKALEKAGITKDTPNPFGGEIGHMENGEPNGRFFDHATFMFTKPIYTPAADVYKKVYRNFMEKAAKCGVTAVGDLFPAGVGHPDVYSIFREMENDGELDLRIAFYPEIVDFDAEVHKSICDKYHSDKLACKGTKELVDGVITVHTAYMLEPYTDDPTTCGQTAIEREVLRKDILKCCEAGVAVRLHTIGDGAVRMAMDLIEEGEKKYGYHGERHGIEHVESIHPDDISRLKELGIIANMQPMHTVFDPDDEEYFRGERVKYCWATRDILDSGAVLAFGTDFPIVELDPLFGIYAGVTRRQLGGYPEGGWQIHQAVTVGEAMKAYTYGAAYATDRENEIGSLKEGKLADIVVINENLFEIPPEEIKDAKVQLTIFDGKVVFSEI